MSGLSWKYSGECAGILTELLYLGRCAADRDPEEPEGLKSPQLSRSLVVRGKQVVSISR